MQESVHLVGTYEIMFEFTDVNECQVIAPCKQFEECINTPGSFRCQDRGNICANGYRMDRETGFCVGKYY